MRRSLLIVLASAAVGIAARCAPANFVRTHEPSWASIEIREDLDFEQAWNYVIDVLARKFDLEVISKDGGYVRSSWIHNWWKPGELTEDYRVRVLVKFSPDRKVLDIRTEANYFTGGSWVLGTDNSLLKTAKSDLMGVVGRTTR